jgi:hypothetical protein
MIVRKVRGQNKLHPIRMSVVEAKLAREAGLTLEEYAQAYVLMIAKQRRWKWYLETHK